MNAIDPRVPPSLVPNGSRARVINGPKGEWVDLPAVRTPSQVITRWEPTAEEREAIGRGEDVYITFLTKGTINPTRVSVGPIDWNLTEP